jgi:hypothetical protein
MFPNTFNLFGFQIFWLWAYLHDEWLFQKRIFHPKLNIYVFMDDGPPNDLSILRFIGYQKTIFYIILFI